MDEPMTTASPSTTNKCVFYRPARSKSPIMMANEIAYVRPLIGDAMTLNEDITEVIAITILLVGLI
jgi:hypothetical protein